MLKIKDFLLQDAKERFLRYVQIHTAAIEGVEKPPPSSEAQWELAKLLRNELEDLQLEDVELDEYCYVYATLPASEGVTGPPLTFCAHLDTSPAESGKDVKPIIHEQYDGGFITFPDNPELVLSPQESPELTKFVGQNIITASGKTLLGADDKAGIAEIMAALTAFERFKELPHPKLKIVFTPDEEIGAGTAKIDLARLGGYGYTMDGGDMGELETECFDAYNATIRFYGINTHPGDAKNRLVNAAEIAARFLAALPEHDMAEHSEKREGFFHLKWIKGDPNLTEMAFHIRDFERSLNLRRVEYLEQLSKAFELRYKGLKIELDIQEAYKNMKEVLDQHPEVTQKAVKAIEMAGLTLIKKAIRGGTDGARLSFMGMPTPNIFNGGLLPHSKKEWIPEIALQKAAEVIIYLCQLWAEEQ